MKQKKQLVYIQGGQSFDTHKEFLNYLRSTPFDPFKEKEGKWAETLEEMLGEDFFVIRMMMPCKQNAKYDEWKIWFERAVPFLKDGVVLVGWSLGANFLAKYLSENEFLVKVSATHIIAGCFGYAGGFKLPESLAMFAKQSERIFIYHSKDDPLVDFADSEKYKKSLPGAEKIDFENKGHFFRQEFPELFERLKI
ncbi:MAG: alpha/beta hydrolase [Patescibacteria group bacterium]